ncbi:MAG TPA: hypothetical protein VGC13_09600 [Longimicrobium sp.]|jgi:hypothetical protein|uniref:hypothetical protein n=1 Tax=Longimicrobium sp. TaxID=2029185 RepID=UPI002ED97128
MKCIHCGKVSLQRERTNKRCPGCGHRFAFDPPAGPRGVTDVAFQDAIDRVSGGGRLRFTARHLWHAVNGPLRMPPPPPGTGSFFPLFMLGVVLPVAAIALLARLPILLFVAGQAGVIAVLAKVVGAGAAHDRNMKYAEQLAPLLPFDLFLSHQLQLWREAHGDVPGLLPPREAGAAAEPPQLPADALSWDRVVVTDRWETAQMLVANGFHLECGCAVLSVDGYPECSADTVKEMLRRSPHLTVFALHDASADGCRLPLDVREPEWFPAPSVRVVDLGLRPETVKRLRLPAIPGRPWRLPDLSPRLDGLLHEEDVWWLGAGNVGELAAFPPEQVMRAAHQAMVAAGLGGASGGAPAYDDAAWSALADWFRALGADADAADGSG